MERYNWEYIVKTFDRNSDEHMELELRKLGDACWELVTVTTVELNDGVAFTVFLKRQNTGKTLGVRHFGEVPL